MRRAEPYELARPEPQRGGWETLQPMFGDESDEDLGSWMWSDAVIAVLLVATLALIFTGVI
jgi:hypothetical protein